MIDLGTTLKILKCRLKCIRKYGKQQSLLYKVYTMDNIVRRARGLV